MPDGPYMPLLNNVAMHPDYEGDLGTNDYHGDLATNNFTGEYAEDLESNAPASSNTSPTAMGTEAVEMRPLIPNTQRAQVNVYVGGSTENEIPDSQTDRHTKKIKCNTQ